MGESKKVMKELARLEQTVERFCQFIISMPKSDLAERAWGPKEVLAHLVYHHELYVSLVEAFLADDPVAPPKGTFRELNAAAVNTSRSLPVNELCVRFRTANQRLIALARQHDPTKITIEIKAGAKLRTLSGLIPEAEAHIRNHHKKLR